MITEDQIFHIICDERETFHRDGPAKTTNDLWQRKAARRIFALITADDDPHGFKASAEENLRRLSRGAN